MSSAPDFLIACVKCFIMTQILAFSRDLSRSMSHGYLEIRIGGRNYKVHRLAFLYMTGIWPPHEIDHINNDRADNRWANLGMATHAKNICNVPVRKHSASGVKGVSWHSRLSKWKAQISLNGKTRYLGIRDTCEEAAALYADAAVKYHGEFARIV